MKRVRSLRLHDPRRRPSSWADIVRAGQFVAFASDADSAVPCEADGRRFADPSEGTCLVFDSFEEARQGCDGLAMAVPSVRFEVFDSKGRTNPPLLTVVHPSRARTLDTNPAVLGRKRALAWALSAAGVLLVALAYWERQQIEPSLFAIIGVNMLLAAGRLFWLDMIVRETERTREARLAETLSGASRTP